jgi:hypothetical protein
MAMIYIADDVRSIAARLKEIEAERKPVRQGKEAAPAKPAPRPDWRNSGSAPRRASEMVPTRS